jgi:mannose-6-phosphate isomerase-like protein (cupin superfamily)
MKYVFETAQCKRYQFPTHINDIVIDRTESTTSEVFVVIVEPGKAVHFHAHDDYEQIFYIIEGEGVLVIGPDKKEYPVKPTQVVRIPMKTIHSIHPKGNVPVRYLSIDCFGSERKSEEPTWDAHVKVICREQGYDYNKVAI